MSYPQPPPEPKHRVHVEPLGPHDQPELLVELEQVAGKLADAEQGNNKVNLIEEFEEQGPELDWLKEALCLTCVHQPCVCILTYLELKIKTFDKEHIEGAA